ncbi:cTAGE family member 5 isoform X1 [Hemitrygon akajei]|uniref:cTAGE family member 5 isoform X1 n=1 Tax=Hemitrygon akajei TaxID=2704970 RepID=UPI003BF9BDD5
MAPGAALSTSLLFLQLIPGFMVSKLSDFKLCGDPQCERHLSRVTAMSDYTGRDCRFLTFKHGDSIFVYLKLTGKRDDLWAGSIGKQFGYFPKDAVKVDDVITSTELELPTQDNDFLCLNEENYLIDDEENDFVINEYGENSFSNSEETEATLEHGTKFNKYNQVDEGNSAKTEPVDNIINFHKRQIQRTHHTTKLEMNSGKEQLQKSLAPDENVQINEILSPVNHQNQLNDESGSRHTDNNEFDLFTFPGSVQNEHISAEKDELPGQEISDDNPITMENNEVSEVVQEESGWIGSRISGWFGLEAKKDEQAVEPNDLSIQQNSFKSRKIPLDNDEDTVLSEGGDKNMYYEAKGILDSGMSGWIGGLSKLLTFNSDLSEDSLSSKEGENNKHENSYLADDSTDLSKPSVTKSGNKISEHSVADHSRPKHSQSENIDKGDQSLMSNVQSLFGLSDKSWFGQINDAQNSDVSGETEVTREESRNDNDQSEYWWVNLNAVSNVFSFGGDNGGQTFRPSEEAQNINENEKAPEGKGKSNSQWSHSSLSKMLGFSQGNEDEISTLLDETKETIIENNKKTTLDVDRSKSQRGTFGLKDILMFNKNNEDCSASNPLEEKSLCTVRDKKENTMDTKSEESSSTLKSITDSLINDDTVQSPKQCLNMVENDANCQPDSLPQSEEEYRETKSEHTQSTLSINGLKNNFDGKTSKSQGVQDPQDFDFLHPSRPSTQESIHKDQSLQEHLIHISEIKQHLSDDTKTLPYENVHSGEKLHGEREDAHNQGLNSEEQQIAVMSKHDPLAPESLSEEEQSLTMHSKWRPNDDPHSETTFLTEADNADRSLWGKLQVEHDLPQDNLASGLKSEQHTSNATDRTSINKLQNGKKFSQEQIVNPDLKENPVSDSDQHQLEEQLQNKPLTSQEKDVNPALQFEELGDSGNNKLLSQTQTDNEQQTLSLKLSEISSSSQVSPSSQNELYNEEASVQVTHFTSAEEQTSDHYNSLSEKVKKQEVSQLNRNDEGAIATNISDETWQLQSMQQVSYHTRDLSKENPTGDQNALQHQSLTLDSESNQDTSDYSEYQNVEEPVMKEPQLLKSATTELVSDAEKPFSLKMHDEDGLQAQQATAKSELQWPATSKHEEDTSTENVHVNEDFVQTDALIHISDESKVLVKEKLNDKNNIHEKEQTLSHLLSNSQPEGNTLSYDDKTPNQGNSSYQQNSMEDEGLYLESENQLVVLNSTVDSSEEDTTAPVNSGTTTKTENSNKVHSSLETEAMVELFNSLPSGNVNPHTPHSSKHQDADTKIKSQHVVKETEYQINQDYTENNFLGNEKTTQLSSESFSANLQKDEAQSNSEQLIMTSARERKDSSKPIEEVHTRPEASSENVLGTTSTSKDESGAEEESVTSKDAFSSGDISNTQVTSNEQNAEILEETVQTSKFLQEQSGTKDNRETSNYQAEEKARPTHLSEAKEPSVSDDPEVGTPTDNDIEYETSFDETAAHKLSRVFELNVQNFLIIVDNFIQNTYQTVMDTLSEDLGASSDFHGPCTELFLISVLLGIITALLFIYRTCQAVKSRRYMGREKQLAEKVSQLFDEKCKILETLSSCKQKYNEFEVSVKDAASLKQSTETKTLHLQDSYAKLDKSNNALRQTIDQFTQDLEAEKQTRSQQSNLITELQENLNALENEAQNLKMQIEEAKKELKGIQTKDAKHQESFQAAKEENYHLVQSQEQLLQESEGWNERYNELTEHIKLGIKSQNDIREVLTCKENEAKSLTDCLLKMKLWNVAEGDNLAEEISEEGQKQKIEKLINVAKLNASLKSVEEERNQIHSKLSDEVKAKQELMERIEKLQLEHTSAQCMKTQFETEYKTIQRKLKIMTELYHEKEMELQRNLTLEEHQRLQKEEKLSEVDEKINQANEELTIYRQRAKDLEEELTKTMQSYKNQIVSHEKKAHDNWLSAREAERELGNVKRENVHLRQKITEAEFKMDIALKDPLVIEVSGTAALSASALGPPYRGRSSPYGPSPVGRPGSEPVGFLSPPLLDGPLRFSPLFPGKPEYKTRGPSIHLDRTTNENTDSVSDRMSDQHGPQSDSGSLSPVWERDRKLCRTSPALICEDGRPKLENSMQTSNFASESQAQDCDSLNVSLNQSLPVEAEFGIRPGFPLVYPSHVPSLPVDLRGHVPLRGHPLPPRVGMYGPPERLPLRAFGLPPHPSMGIRDPLRPYVSNFPPPRPTFLPPRPVPGIVGGLLPSRLPLPRFSSTEHPSSQDK